MGLSADEWTTSLISCLDHMLLLPLLLSCFSHVRLCATPETAAHQAAPSPWDSPGKNTGVGCHFLLQCMKVKSESEVTQSCPTLSDPMDCSLPGSSIHGIFQARVLEWGAIAFSSKTTTHSQFSSSLMILAQFTSRVLPVPNHYMLVFLRVSSLFFSSYSFPKSSNSISHLIPSNVQKTLWSSPQHLINSKNFI